MRACLENIFAFMVIDFKTEYPEVIEFVEGNDENQKILDTKIQEEKLLKRSQNQV
jgi:hypothetical protein